MRTGTLDSSFNPGFGGSVYSMLLQPDGRVLVGSSDGLAWLNSDGSRDPCFNPTINHFLLLSSRSRSAAGRKVLVGGSFSTVNGVSRNGIARLNSNGSLDSSFDTGTGADGLVRAIALQPDDNVLIGGDFLTVNGVVRPYVARLFGGSSGPRLRLFPTNQRCPDCRLAFILGRLYAPAKHKPEHPDLGEPDDHAHNGWHGKSRHYFAASASTFFPISPLMPERCPRLSPLLRQASPPLQEMAWFR